MHSWSVQDAKARFSELLDTCMSEGIQVITKRGTEAAVLIPVEEWHRLNDAAKPSLKSLLLSDNARVDFDLPSRGQAKRRALLELD